MHGTLQPIKNLVALEKIKGDLIQNSIILTESKPSMRYLVMAVGPEVRYLLPGDTVLCSRDAGQLATVKDKVLRLVKESDILAIEL